MNPEGDAQALLDDTTGLPSAPRPGCWQFRVTSNYAQCRDGVKRKLRARGGAGGWRMA